MQNRRDGQMRVKINGKRIDVNKAYIKIGFYSMIKEGYRLVLRTNEGKFKANARLIFQNTLKNI